MSRTLAQIDTDLDTYWNTVGKARGDELERLQEWRDKLEWERIGVEKAQDLAEAKALVAREKGIRERLFREQEELARRNAAFEKPVHPSSGIVRDAG